MQQFPVGGPREPVYAYMRSLGFSMAKFSDKRWNSADGIEVHIFGAGSKAHVRLNDTQLSECDLGDVGEQIDMIRRMRG